jgi:membrane protein DedA with SNARE-associated domain
MTSGGSGEQRSRAGTATVPPGQPEPAVMGGAVAAGVGGVGMPGLFGLLLVMEAGVPVPIPGDLVMLLVGEWGAAGAVPLWLALVTLELIAVVGTGTTFLLARGPARALLARAGPRVGLTSARLDRAAALLEHRGRAALAAGRCTPGLRTVTVVTAASARLHPARALPALVLGSSVFLQAHLLLGLLAGAAARQLLDEVVGRLRVPLLIGLVVLLAALAVWLLRRRGRSRAGQVVAEGCCPVCLAAGAVLVDRQGEAVP